MTDVIERSIIKLTFAKSKRRNSGKIFDKLASRVQLYAGELLTEYSSIEWVLSKSGGPSELIRITCLLLNIVIGIDVNDRDGIALEQVGIEVFSDCPVIPIFCCAELLLAVCSLSAKLSIDVNYHTRDGLPYIISNQSNEASFLIDCIGFDASFPSAILGPPDDVCGRRERDGKVGYPTCWYDAYTKSRYVDIALESLVSEVFQFIHVPRQILSDCTSFKVKSIIHNLGRANINTTYVLGFKTLTSLSLFRCPLVINCFFR